MIIAKPFFLISSLGTRFGLGVRELLLQLATYDHGGGGAVAGLILGICLNVFVIMYSAYWLPTDHHYLA